MQTPEAPVEEAWGHYRVSFTLRITARDEEQAKAIFSSYFHGEYLGGVQEEIGFEVNALDGQWNPISEDEHLEAQYETQVSGDSDLP